MSQARFLLWDTRRSLFVAWVDWTDDIDTARRFLASQIGSTPACGLVRLLAPECVNEFPTVNTEWEHDPDSAPQYDAGK